MSLNIYVRSYERRWKMRNQEKERKNRAVLNLWSMPLWSSWELELVTYPSHQSLANSYVYSSTRGVERHTWTVPNSNTTYLFPSWLNSHIEMFIYVLKWGLHATLNNCFKIKRGKSSIALQEGFWVLKLCYLFLS